MEKINFKNLPDTSTPINATNLNAIQTNTENAINQISLYSTNEIKVGQWANNKPIYRKVLYFNNPNLNTNIQHGILNIDEIINLKMILKEGSNSYRLLPVIYIENNVINPRFSISLYTFDNTNLLITAGSYYTENINNLSLNIIVEYTKTTD